MTTNRTRQESPAETPSAALEAGGLVASTLAYVHTVDDEGVPGVVQVDPGEPLPVEAIEGFAAQLRERGVFVSRAEYDDLVAAQAGGSVD